jgi:outer membrane protein assembly factor BamB
MMRTVTLLILLATGSLGAAAENNWPAFRGPQGTGVAPKADPPLEWSEEKNIRWKVAMPGPGHATPAVWGDRIYVLAAVKTDKEVEPSADEPGSSRFEPDAPTIIPAMMQQGQRPPRRRGPMRSAKPTHIHQFVVLAIERATGETIWQTVVREELPHESGHVTASQASASPVTDGEHVWASFGSRGIYCLDKNGKVVWEKDYGEMRTRNEFGEGSSPVLHGDTIFLTWDHEGDSFLVALDKRTGDERWKVDRDEPTSWATPLVVEDGDKPLLVVSGTNRVRAYDPADGKVVWESGGLGLNCVPTPVADEQRVFVMSGYREAAGLAIRYRGARGDITDTDKIAWRLDAGLSYVPSPLLYDGKLYFLERFSGMLSSYDLATGKEIYTKQRLEGLGNIYASLVGAKGRVYVLSRDGKAVVFKHGKKFELLAKNELDDAFDASPVVVGKELILRGHEYLYNVAAP